MDILLTSILAFAVTAGQLIRIPIGIGAITILDITISLFCLGGILRLKFNLKKPPRQIFAALIFLSLATISLIFTPLNLTKEEHFISFSYTVRFFLYVFFPWLAFSNAFGNLKENLTRVFLLSGISFAILGLLQFFFFPNLSFLNLSGWDPHYFRTVSTFLDPNFAGAFLVLTIMLIFQNFANYKKWNIIFFLIIFLALLTTFSRSSYLMLLVSGLTFSLLKKSKTFAFATILLFVLLLIGFQVYTNLVAEPRNIDRTQSASFRLNTWQQGLTLFQSHPFLGVGFNSYRYALKNYNLGDEQFLQSHGSSSNDSSLLFVASTTGILGLLVYLYFLWVLFKPSNGNFILTAGVAGLLIHSLFANSLFYPPILAWLLFISVNPKK